MALGHLPFLRFDIRENRFAGRAGAAHAGCLRSRNEKTGEQASTKPARGNDQKAKRPPIVGAKLLVLL